MDPLPCIYPLGLPAAAGSPALSDILFHTSSAFWLVPAKFEEVHVREDSKLGTFLNVIPNCVSSILKEHS